MVTRLPVVPGDDLCIARVPLFQGLTHQEQLQVAQVARPTRVDRDEQVYATGSDVSQLMVVHTGRVKISRLSPDGHEQTRWVTAGSTSMYSSGLKSMPVAGSGDAPDAI
mgnify:CR=1 FL=1